MSMSNSITSLVTLLITLVIIMVGELAFGPVVDGFSNFATSVTLTGISPEFTTSAVENFAWFHTGLRLVLEIFIVWVVIRTIMSAFYTREARYQ